MVLDGNGYWHFSFRPDNSYRIVLNDRLVIVQHGKLSVKDNLVTFDDVSRFCLARSQGTYRWEVQNELLNISLVRDTCLYGRYALTKGLVPITPLSLSKRLALGTFQKHWHNSGGDGYQDVERWWLKLEEDGSFTLHSDGLTTYQGQTTMIKDRLWLRFTGTPLCVTEPGAAALGADSSAVYQWRIDTKGIQLDAVLDGCSERRRMMSEGLWMRKRAP